ncbi:HNH endonuclease [Marinicauda salina]|uniref:HNH endonuclease n=2 Tax=Marinicauda salina TaxID=2135793 RepID=A0A2U2BR33_9PROT|nr:HNH endonuclease [Marinicauda salina]
MDAVAEAGVDVSDWGNYAKGPTYAAANPKYCYEWAFVEPGKVVVLNLWFQKCEIENDRIIQRNNFRVDALHFRQKKRPVPQWAARVDRLDDAVRTAAFGGVPLRVVFVDGQMQDAADPDDGASKVTRRDLDPEPWRILFYDDETGEHVIERGLMNGPYIDQFNLDLVAKGLGEQSERTGLVFNRDGRVRDAALRRAAGKCEYCGAPGFKTTSGALYLETHHIIPLAEGGADNISNVIAICPNDHRRAHFGENASKIREEMLACVAGALRLNLNSNR